MRFHSTRRTCPAVSFREAVLHGLAPDGGLYMPDALPKLPDRFWDSLPGFTLPEIAAEVARHFVGDEIPADDLRPMLDDAFNFEAPIVAIDGDDHVLELFHGPTLAFKDFGARFLARVLAWFHRGEERPLTILVATSGDTGGAVADGFLGLAGLRVVVLYPSGQVSRIQEQQLTTLGENVTAVEVSGTFDDCQRLVKQAFADHQLRERVPLTSANSISIGRLLPQTFYYLHAYGQLIRDRSGKRPRVRNERDQSAAIPQDRPPIVFSVPSGNFGNLTAGLLAWRMGLPVRRIVAATNPNDVVPVYLQTSEFRPRPSVHTLSNAMDVGDPSNFARMRELFGEDWHASREALFGASFSDTETLETIRRVHDEHGYVLDPHSAVAWMGLRQWREAEGGACTGVALATAHPAKFIETVEQATATKVAIPERLRRCLDREKRAVPIGVDYAALRELLGVG